ncbi:immunity protein Tsi6 family protein [Phocaeicola sp.]
MYIRLYEKATKNYYRQILDETIAIINSNLEQPPLPVYQSVLNQLFDIKENVVKKALLVDPEEISERYSLGGIAVKNFDDNVELQNRLMDIFMGVCDYVLLDE